MTGLSDHVNPFPCPFPFPCPDSAAQFIRESKSREEFHPMTKRITYQEDCAAETCGLPSFPALTCRLPGTGTETETGTGLKVVESLRMSNLGAYWV